MKVGDIVKFGKWYTGRKRQSGIIVEADANHNFFLVLWRLCHREWEDGDELELAK